MAFVERELGHEGLIRWSIALWADALPRSYVSFSRYMVFFTNISSFSGANKLLFW